MRNFLLIDDHEVVRAGVKIVLTELYKPSTIYEAHDEKSALKQLKSTHFDLVIMDVQMPDTNTVSLIEYITITYPDVKVLMFSMSAENIYAKRFLKAGAMGFVSKNAGMAELKKAIDLVLGNRRYISETLIDIMAGDIGKKENGNPFDKLSARELDIATLMMKGKSISEIADQLNITVSTTGTYKSRLFDKLSVKNIAELIELGRVFGII
ncbi:MAG: hypothetical protein RL172_2767 [Bacteroidota bacterium]|jgi:two-component system, NarL family, invasion response regulator UvrY